MKAAALLATLLTACASQPPDPAEIAARDYRRDNGRIEAIERFDERKRQCAARGGAMHVPRSTSGRLPPERQELRLASCGARPGSASWY